MQLIPLKTPVITPEHNLQEVFKNALNEASQALQEGDIIVIASKVIAVTEGRVVELKDIIPTEKARSLHKLTYTQEKEEEATFTQLVLSEADKVYPGKLLLTLKHHMLIPSAGIDRSNTPEGTAILWPATPQKTANEWQNFLKKEFNLTECGTVISDSTCQPMRQGVRGIALAFSGFEGVEDERGKPDIYNRPLTVTQKATADNLCSAASVVMGEGSECHPFVIIRNAPVQFTEREVNAEEMFIEPGRCIFEGLYAEEIKKET